jgi:hypothetical protein
MGSRAGHFDADFPQIVVIVVLSKAAIDSYIILLENQLEKRIELVKARRITSVRPADEEILHA